MPLALSFSTESPLINKKLFSHRPFRTLFLGQTISVLGDGFYFISFAFMVEKVTGQPKYVGYNLFWETLPFVLLGPFAGAIADRIDRRKIVLASDLACGILIGSLSLLTYFVPRPPVEIFFLISALMGSVRVFFHPAKNAAIPRLVPDDLLEDANSVNGAVSNLMPLISLAVTATVLSAIYEKQPQWFFVLATGLNSLSFLVSAYFVAKLPPIVPDRSDVHETSALQDAAAGVSFLKTRADLAMYLGLVMITHLSMSPFFVFYVASNKEWFGGKPRFIAFCEAIFSLGMVLSSLAVPKFKIRKVGLAWILAVIALGLSIAVMGLSKHEFPYLFWNFACGLFLPFAILPMNTYIQRTVPDEYRGRYNSLSTIVSSAAYPIGGVLGAQLLSGMGLQGGYYGMGIAMSIGALLGFLSAPFRTSLLPEASTASEG